MPFELTNLVVTAFSALVGTVVACEGGSDTFAFATVLPLSKEKVVQFIFVINAGFLEASNLFRMLLLLLLPVWTAASD